MSKLNENINCVYLPQQTISDSILKLHAFDIFYLSYFPYGGENVSHGYTLYNIKRNKYKTACTALSVVKFTFDRMVMVGCGCFYDKKTRAVVVMKTRDRILVEFTTTYAISTYHHQRCEFESRSGEAYSIQNYLIVCH